MNLERLQSGVEPDDDEEQVDKLFGDSFSEK